MQRVVVLAIAAVTAVLACTSNTDTPPAFSPGNESDAAAATPPDPPPPEGGACNPFVPGQDPTTLPNACCMDQGGQGHCLPADQVSASEVSQLSTCPGTEGVCVPDAMIRAGSAFQPATCTSSITNGPGACLSVCFPQIAQYKSLLKADGCADGTLCAPCTDPQTNMPSGACDPPPSDCDAGFPRPVDASTTPTCPHMGPPVIDPTKLPSCDTSHSAHCLSANLVPPSQQAQLAKCPNNQGYCIPDLFLETGGDFILETCSSIDSAEGRCMNVVIPQVASQKDQLPQDVCKPYERCLPCFSPVDGTDTGLCHQGCDPGPTKPKVVFKNCCTLSGTTYGKCVPSSMVPASEQSNLSTDVCVQGKELCIATEMLQPGFLPPKCQASGLLGNYDGVCLSNCLDFGVGGIVLDQGNCDAVHTCAPCKDPVTGNPTGAPGCPP